MHLHRQPRTHKMTADFADCTGAAVAARTASAEGNTGTATESGRGASRAARSTAISTSADPSAKALPSARKGDNAGAGRCRHWLVIRVGVFTCMLELVLPFASGAELTGLFPPTATPAAASRRRGCTPARGGETARASTAACARTIWASTTSNDTAATIPTSTITLQSIIRTIGSSCRTRCHPVPITTVAAAVATATATAATAATASTTTTAVVIAVERNRIRSATKWLFGPLDSTFGGVTALYLIRLTFLRVWVAASAVLTCPMKGMAAVAIRPGTTEESFPLVVIVLLNSQNDARSGLTAVTKWCLTRRAPASAPVTAAVAILVAGAPLGGTAPP
mmetsp:Transcript_18182/g.46550  ORF Transcript_18182/g.46550 Transcript_18182/m.46550 type:complete len:337 (-) Transcript_18182:113-1123(-)